MAVTVRALVREEAGQVDLDSVRRADHVIVGEDVTVLVDEEPASVAFRIPLCTEIGRLLLAGLDVDHAEPDLRENCDSVLLVLGSIRLLPSDSCAQEAQER